MPVDSLFAAAQGDAVTHAAATDCAGFILVVDDDPLRRATLACALLRIERVAVLAASTRECKAVAAAIAPAIIVIVPGPGGSVAEEPAQVLAASERTACLLIGQERDPLLQRLPEALERVHVVPVPLSLEVLEPIVRKYIPDPAAGPFSPAEYVQLAGLGAHSVTLVCSDSSGVTAGTIVIREGQVHHARAGGQRGFDAFASLVTRTDIRVRLTAPTTQEEAQEELQGSWQALVLEAMRRYDEGVREPPVVAERSVSALGRESDFSALLSDPPGAASRHPLARAASVPALPVTEMREALSSSRAATSEEARALVEQGVRAVIGQDYERAIQALERALELSPKNASVRHRLDRLYAIVGRSPAPGAER